MSVEMSMEVADPNWLKFVQYVTCFLCKKRIKAELLYAIGEDGLAHYVKAEPFGDDFGYYRAECKCHFAGIYALNVKLKRRRK